MSKIIGSIIGAQVASHVRGINGPAGALLGAGIMSVIRRMGPLGLIVALIGGFVIKRYNRKREARRMASLR